MGFPTRAGTRLTRDENVNKLLKQLEVIFYESNAGCKKSRKVRFHQYKAFLKFATVRFGLCDIRNIKPSYVRAFIKWRMGNEIREGTILADLSTIRFWHRQIPLRKYNMPPNDVLLGRGEFRDRSWKRC
ncbi:MAG: hypothetical protein FH756_10665 [Firmicutes bacterium]|nr:hypothetical protein [Bacillota bacterium]